MKNYSFYYTGRSQLEADLRHVADLASAGANSAVWIQAYIMDEDGACIQPIADAIRSCLPEAKFYITHAAMAFSDSGIRETAALIVCNLFEDPRTRVELRQFPFEPADYEKSVDEAIDYVLANPWIKMISVVTGGNLTGAYLLSRLTERVSPDIVISGGAAATITMSVPTQVLSSDGPLSTSPLVMSFLGGESFHARADVIVGWKGIGKEFTITRSNGSTIYEIDGRPAFDIYREYLKIESDPGMIVSQTIEFPLCFEDNGTLFLRCPFILNEDGSMLMMLSDLNEGKKVRLSFGSPDLILDEIANKLSDIAGFEPQVISVNSCLGRFFFWGPNLKNELALYPELAQFSGFLSGGELLRQGSEMHVFNETIIAASMREGDLSPDGSGVHKIERVQSDVSLTRRLATFIDTVTSDLEKNNRLIKHMAITDALTGLNNRREIESIIEHSCAEGRAFSLIMLDADNFKKINDTLGHEEGDRVLRCIADAITGTILSSDLEVHAGRWGGDEFMMLCLSEDPAKAVCFAEELQKKYSDLSTADGYVRTLSIGIAGTYSDLSSRSIYKAVDDKLYEAKSAGKGRIAH